MQNFTTPRSSRVTCHKQSNLREEPGMIMSLRPISESVKRSAIRKCSLRADEDSELMKQTRSLFSFLFSFHFASNRRRQRRDETPTHKQDEGLVDEDEFAIPVRVSVVLLCIASRKVDTMKRCLRLQSFRPEVLIIGLESGKRNENLCMSRKKAYVPFK